MPEEKLKNCFDEKDFETSVFIKSHCGLTDYEYKKKNLALTIELPNNNKIYGANSLYCEYSIDNVDEIKSLTINSKKKWGQLKMKIEYMDSGEDKQFILGNEEKYIINKPKTIKIIFHSNEERNIPPFSVKISDTLIPANVVLIIIFVICSFIVIILIIFCIIIYIKRQRRLNNSGHNENNNHRNYNIENNENNSENTERIELENYLKRFKVVKFKDIKDKSLNFQCLFEYDIFDDNSEVIFNSCGHSYHFKCIKEYINKNIQDIKLKGFNCFYCFKPFLQK